MPQTYGPGQYDDNDDCVRDLLRIAWSIADAAPKPASMTDDAKPDPLNRICCDAVDLIREWQGGKRPSDAEIESIVSRLDSVNGNSLAESVLDAHDAIVTLIDEIDDVTKEKDALEEASEEIQSDLDLAADLKEHGYTPEQVESVLWRAGIISTGESAGQGIARMIDDVRDGKAAAS